MSNTARSYNSRISAWALPSVPPNEEVTSWVEFATANGLDPNEWDLTDPR